MGIEFITDQNDPKLQATLRAEDVLDMALAGFAMDVCLSALTRTLVYGVAKASPTPEKAFELIDALIAHGKTHLKNPKTWRELKATQTIPHSSGRA